MSSAPHIDWSTIPLGTDSDRAIGERYGIAPHVVASARMRRGIPPVRKAGALLDMRTPYAEDDRCWYVVEAHPDGLTLEEIGSLFGVTRERIRQIETQALRHFTARLALAGITEDDVRELFARRAQGA